MTTSQHDDMPRTNTAPPNSPSNFRYTMPDSNHNTEPRSVSRDQEPLLSVRTTTLLLLATCAGIVAGVLASMAGQPLPAAVLLGAGAASGTLGLFHSLVARQ